MILQSQLLQLTFEADQVLGLETDYLLLIQRKVF